MYFDQTQLYKIARHQKGLLVSLLFFFLSPFVALTIGKLVLDSMIQNATKEQQSVYLVVSIGGLLLVMFVLGVWNTVSFFMLAFAMEMGTPSVLVYFVGFFVPIVSLVMVLVVSSKATKALKDAGYKVGLLGADLEEVKADLYRGSGRKLVSSFR